MELIELSKKIIETAHKIEGEKKELQKLAKEKAVAEMNYRTGLMKAIFQLKAEGCQMAIISDLARGMVADYKFTRDLADSLFTSQREILDASLGVLTAYQSILRIQRETGE